VSLTDHEKQLIADFARHPSWEILNRLHLEQRSSKLAELTRTLFAAKPAEQIDQLEFAYWRGYFRGQRYLLNIPKLGAKHLPAEPAFDEGDDDA
jgi:hypothetical protein